VAVSSGFAGRRWRRIAARWFGRVASASTWRYGCAPSQDRLHPVVAREQDRQPAHQPAIRQIFKQVLVGLAVCVAEGCFGGSIAPDRLGGANARENGRRDALSFEGSHQPRRIPDDDIALAIISSRPRPREAAFEGSQVIRIMTPGLIKVG